MKSALPLFLIDMNVGEKVEHWLINMGYNILSVRDINIRMEDNEILETAFKENRVIITMDKDFGELIFRLHKSHCGVLLLRLEDESAKNKIFILSKLLETYIEDIRKNFCVYSKGRFRIKSFERKNK